MRFHPFRHHTLCKNDIVGLSILSVLASPLTFQISIDKVSFETLSRRRNLSSLSIQHTILPYSLQRSNFSIHLLNIQLSSPMTFTVPYFTFISLVVFAIHRIPKGYDAISVLDTLPECTVVSSHISDLVRLAFALGIVVSVIPSVVIAVCTLVRSPTVGLAKDENAGLDVPVVEGLCTKAMRNKEVIPGYYWAVIAEVERHGFELPSVGVLFLDA